MVKIVTPKPDENGYFFTPLARIWGPGELEVAYDLQREQEAARKNPHSLVDSLAARLDAVEKKLDRLLAPVEQKDK